MLEGYLNAQPDGIRLNVLTIRSGLQTPTELGLVIWLKDYGLSLPWRKGFLC